LPDIHHVTGGDNVGFNVGKVLIVGILDSDGNFDGKNVGIIVSVGLTLRCKDGFTVTVGRNVGFEEGDNVFVGVIEGSNDGLCETVGACEYFELGEIVILG
jgi:hypothetical protein